MSKELTYEQASKRLKELQYAKARMGQLSINDEIHKKALEISLPMLQQQERSIKQIKCPLPCGWKELLRLAMHDGAFLAKNLIEGVEVNNEHRHAAFSNTDRLVTVITAMMNAQEQQERGQGDWIEWGGGECPVSGEKLVEIKMRNGGTDGPRKAGDLSWHNGNAVRDEMGCDIIAYRIIPERAINQNGEQ